MRRSVALGLLLASMFSVRVQAGADEDWASIMALDAGPRGRPASREEAVLVVRTHLNLHRKAIETFLSKYPRDPRAVEAKLRLAGVMAAEGRMNNETVKVDDALRLLAELEASPDVPAAKRADVGFQRASIAVQVRSEPPERRREAVAWVARNFTTKYPGDRRGPRLLVEAATVCDDDPALKRKLLEEARALTEEESLKRRIADDLKRLDLVGKPFAQKLSMVDGGNVDFAALRGNVVVLIFWATESPHSLLWLRDFRISWKELPKERLRVVTVNLDRDRKAMTEKLRNLPPVWATHFDGLGWESPLVRALGINALPTVWLFDRSGVLRSLDGRTNCESKVRSLLAESAPAPSPPGPGE